MEDRIIIIGSNGQIGSELAVELRNIHGPDAVITADIRQPAQLAKDENFRQLDVLDLKALEDLFHAFKPTQVYLLAAMLSATGEKYPRKAWDLNMNGLFNVFDLAVKNQVRKVFWPSSIAVFGKSSPKHMTPQHTLMEPTTVYGISKLAGERYCAYYHQRYGLDVRSIRYPGLISWKAAPGGGTTDYAIEIFHAARKENSYQCFLAEDTALPMLYMDDAIRATLQLMDAPAEKITQRSSYNLGGMSFTPAELADEIRKHLPDFTMQCMDSDPRQAIADSWPASIDDQTAREDWGWEPTYDLPKMVEEMLKNIQ